MANQHMVRTCYQHMVRISKSQKECHYVTFHLQAHLADTLAALQNLILKAACSHLECTTWQQKHANYYTSRQVVETQMYACDTTPPIKPPASVYPTRNNLITNLKNSPIHKLTSNKLTELI